MTNSALGRYAIIGLGNPGSKYSATRHNLGFIAVEHLHRLKCSDAVWQEKFNCLFAKSKINNKEVFLILPQLYMNKSGEAAKGLLQFYQIAVANTVVLHDDLDLDPGSLRVKRGGSAGGQRGVENLIQMLGSADFVRIRLGIGHPRRTGTAAQSQIDPGDWVLQKPSREEQVSLEQAVADSVAAVELIVDGQFEAAQQQFNKRQRQNEN